MAKKKKKVTTEYLWPKGSPYGGTDAASVAGELEEIQRRKGNPNLRPVDVVDFARDSRTYLHGLFDWNDKSAAEKHRLTQAREILRITVISEELGSSPTRYFVSMRETEKGDLTYIPTIKVMSDTELRKRALQAALAEAQSWRRRYEHLKELAAVFTAIEKATKKVA